MTIETALKKIARQLERLADIFELEEFYSGKQHEASHEQLAKTYDAAKARLKKKWGLV